MKKFTYYVERFVAEWKMVAITQDRPISYCNGVVDALDLVCPSAPMRVIRIDADGNKTVIRETQGRGSVHLN